MSDIYEIRQKTWTDLLGPFNAESERQGRNIVRMTGPASWRILWSFMSETAAIEAYAAWKEGR